MISRRIALLGLAVILLITSIAIVAAMRRTSTTFDEIVMVAGGARGFETGDWHLVPEHPPLVQYVYGLPVFLAGAEYPDEAGVSDELRTHMGYRYLYAQTFYWNTGNDPERIAFLGRLPAVLFALGLIALAFAWAYRLGGPGAGLLAAILTAAVPDVLAHGGVAYNDIALAVAFVAAIAAIDAAVRRPSLLRGLAAGALIALALGVKNSAVTLGPIALVLLVWEAWLRRRDADWRRAILPAALATFAAAYLGLVAVYRGDFFLTEYRYALDFVMNQVTERPAPGYLLGEVSRDGFWYFFPVAFLFKTSAGLHALVALAALSFVAAARVEPRRLLHTRLRAPFVAVLVFGLILMTSDLNIGFRHALPVLPLLTIITAVGVHRLWLRSGVNVRAVIAVAALWPVLHVASYYPFFLSYLSEYGPGEGEAHDVLVDSSLDWGQGLLELRDFMQANGIESVYLSYFGSGMPGGYGITHVPMLSYFPLSQAVERPARPPRWYAVSATLLSGAYFPGDPFRRFREAEPSHIIARTIYLYPMPEPEPVP